MCGICGIFGKREDASRDILERMNDTLVRRGPDDGGSFIDAGIGLAMRRLSIQDVQGGHQPVFNEDRSLCVVFNGEIYNQLELRKVLKARGHHFRTKSDTEVLVHLYEDYAFSMVDHLQGMFAFALYDLKTGKLLIARDRLGIKPLYYMQNSGSFYFSSEIKALRVANPTIDTLSAGALDAFFAYGYIPAPMTIYKEIKKLEPGHLLIVTKGEVIDRKYWDVQFRNKEDLTEKDWVDRLNTSVSSAVKSHLISDVPVGSFLSGGVDSGLVSAIASPSLDYDLQTFTMGFEGKNTPLLDERNFARELAKNTGMNFHEYSVLPDVESIAEDILDAFDEPFSDDSVIPSYYVSQAAAESVKVVLSGLGGDELFGGYQRYTGFLLSTWYQHIPGMIHQRLIDPLVRAIPEPRNGGDRVDHVKRFSAAALLPAANRYARYMSSMDSEDRKQLYTREFAENIDFGKTESIMTSHFENCDSDNYMDRMFYTDLKTYLPDDILALSDRISMWHSLEVRVPLVDHKLVELAARMPAKLKVGVGGGKIPLKRLAERYLPRSMIYHRKQGFEAPMGAWLKDELFDYALGIIKSNSAGSRLIDAGWLEKKLVEHRKGYRKNNKVLFSAIIMLLWADRFRWSL